jgi:hypothetical protein
VDGRGEVLTGNGQVTEGKLVHWGQEKMLVWAQADLRGAFAQKDYNPMAVAQRCFIVLGGCSKKGSDPLKPKGSDPFLLQPLTGPDPYVVVADAFAKDTNKHDFTWLLHGNADSKFDLVRDRATHTSGEAALDVVPCLMDNGAVAFETKMFPSRDFGAHPMLRATYKGHRWLGLTVLAPRRSTERAADVRREMKGERLLVTVTRGGVKDELEVTAVPSGGIAALRVSRTVEGKTVTADLQVK